MAQYTGQQRPGRPGVPASSKMRRQWIPCGTRNSACKQKAPRGSGFRLSTVLVDCFDVPSLEAFTAELGAAGFEPITGSRRRMWRGPIHSAFASLTNAATMDIAIRPGMAVPATSPLCCRFGHKPLNPSWARLYVARGGLKSSLANRRRLYSRGLWSGARMPRVAGRMTIWGGTLSSISSPNVESSRLSTFLRLAQGRVGGVTFNGVVNAEPLPGRIETGALRFDGSTAGALVSCRRIRYTATPTTF